MKIIGIFALGVVLSFVSSARATETAAAQAGWEKINEKDGILVYRQKIEGSKLLAFRGEGDVNATVSRVAQVILDANRAKEWIEDMEESSIVRWLSPTEFLEYDHVGTPIVLKDRDFLSRVTIDVDQAKRQVRLVYRSADAIDAPEDLRKTRYVRGDLRGTNFLLTSIDHDTRTRVTGEVYADPRGSVPKWIVNLFQKDWPVDTLANLRRQVAKPDIKDDARLTRLFSFPASGVRRSSDAP